MSMLTTDGRRITSVATDVTGEHLNALHDRYRDNPCAEAWRHAAVVRAASSTPTRWPLWMTRVEALAVCAHRAAARIHEFQMNRNRCSPAPLDAAS